MYGRFVRERKITLFVSLLLVLVACSTTDSAATTTAKPMAVPTSSAVSTTLASTSTSLQSTTTTSPQLIDSFVSESGESILDSDVCRIRDITPGTPNGSFVNSSGFPVPEGAVGRVGAVRLWVIPVETSDYSASREGLTDLASSLETVVDFYGVQSYGKATLQVRFEGETNWVRLPGSAADFGFGDSRPQQDFSKLMEQILGRWTPSAEVREDDLVLVVLPPVPNVVVTQSTRRFDLKRFNNVLLQNGVLLSSAGNEIRTWELHAHELGHSWLRLEDLYHARADVPYQDYMGTWDIMATAVGPSPTLSGFSRWRAAWIEDDEMTCVDSTIPSRHFVAGLNDADASSKLLVIPTTDHSAIVVEVREVKGSNKPIALVYTVDTAFEHQLGPYRFQTQFYLVDSFQIGDVVLNLIDRDSSGVVIEVAPAA